MARIDALLHEATTGRSGTLLLTGEPGMGKTTLLEAARAQAASFRCLSARGVPADSRVAFGGLLGLLNPIRDRVAEIPPLQSSALAAALAWSDVGASADPFLLGAATLSLLAAEAEHQAVLVLVDDLQWLDPESASAIVFAARRLGPDAVAFLFAAREGAVPADLSDVPLLPVAGLSAAAAAMLLPAHAAPEVVDRLVRDTRGNPLALVEVGARLNEAHWLGAAPLPEPLPTGDRLREHFRTVLGDLSPAAGTTVLYLALVDHPVADTHPVLTKLGEARIDVAATLEEARQRGVLVHERGGHRIRHPLLRGAALELATPAELRAAHAWLARALPAADPRRVWHLAESAAGPSAELADQLVVLAEDSRDRWGHAAASVALERAAELTPDRDLARERLAFAAHDAFQAGDVARVRRLVDRVRAEGVADRSRGEALFTLGMLEQYAGSVPQSVEYLDEASHLLRGAAQVRDLTELAMARFRLNDLQGLAECGRRIDAIADPDDAEQQLMASFTGGVASVLSGDLEAGMARLGEVRRLADLPALRHDSRTLLLMALAAAFTGQVGDAVAVGAVRLQEVRRRGAIGALAPCLTILAAGRAWLGDHAGAYADAGEAAELAAHLGYAADRSVAVEMLAWQSAARGLHADAQRSLILARELTDRAGTTRHAAHQAITAAFCALCRGDLVEVVALLEARVAADGGVGATGEPLGVAPLLVEAYLGLGRTEDARALAARYADVTAPGSPALSIAMVDRCQALTEPDEAIADAALGAALAAHAEGGDPFETARTRLLYGGRLRRAGRRIAAREHLSAARDAFVGMDLTHWVAVAEAELAATGATARRQSATASQPLTSQETRVAMLAAQGLSNKEIGAALFISPKTVERHLGNVFRKRGLRSRTELAASYARSPDEVTAPQMD